MEYKIGKKYKAADAFSRVHDEDDLVEATSMAISFPVPNLLGKLKLECARNFELLFIVHKMESGCEVLFIPFEMVFSSLIVGTA